MKVRPSVMHQGQHLLVDEIENASEKVVGAHVLGVGVVGDGRVIPEFQAALGLMTEGDVLVEARRRRIRLFTGRVGSRPWQRRGMCSQELVTQAPD